MSNDLPLRYGTMIPKLEPDDTDGKPVALTIRNARRQDMAPRGSNRPDVKIIIEFAEEFDGETDDKRRREYVVNSTSYKTLCLKLGSDESKWVGKTVVMAPTVTTFDNQTFEKMHVAASDRWDKVVKASAKAAPAKRR